MRKFGPANCGAFSCYSLRTVYFCFMQTIKIKIEGSVQGVFFRQSAQERATALGIKGTVQNCDDDSVEITATGTRDQLEKLTSWCWEGPPRATVTKVTTQDIPLQSFYKFSIVRL
jgi:acylphosphatase